MKKKALVIVSIMCVCLLLVCLFFFPEFEKKIYISDEGVPLSEGIGTLIVEEQEDFCVIPDKYNTGAEEDLTPFVTDEFISGVKFKFSNGATKLDLFYQSVEIPEVVYVEGYDFSSGKFSFNNADLVEKDVTVIFNNCKFGSYVINGTGNVKHQFENCTFTHFGGSNAEFLNCYFGSGTDGDGINPGSNCTFRNCMIADLIHSVEVASDKHIDGFQIFGSTDGTDNTNITLSNCRFEIPAIPFSAPSGAMNCPITATMRYSNADSIVFEDCYVNGGYYYAMMIRECEQTVSNLLLSNIHIGASSKSLYACDGDLDMYIKDAVLKTDSLYVASVRKQPDGIHISVTNDTAQDRVLSIVTSGGIEKYTINACPKAMNLQKDSVTYADFPFDIDIVIPDSDWVVCFDTTAGINQIRYVNWSGQDVWLDLSMLGDVLVKDNNPVTNDTSEMDSFDTISKNVSETEDVNGMEDYLLDGECGANAYYYLTDGVLTISGSGSTYNYHSGNLAPWYEYREIITEIYVESGITNIGNQMFVGCSNLNTVYFNEDLVSIGTNVFKQCATIETIYIPKSLEKVGSRTFVSGVNYVEYAGTESEWNDINFAKYNDSIYAAEIRYQIADPILYSGVCGDQVEWTFSTNGTLTLKGIGATYNYHSGNVPPWYEYASEIKNIVIEEGVSVLGNFIFRNCSSVLSVELPKSVTAVGTNSFSKCKRLTEITFTNSLISIGKNAFAGTNISVVNYHGTIDEWNSLMGDNFMDAIVKYR
ncbi:MAG: leucine-rich repeat protein [Lachnospiraceae bacterium]|nr:leucine-rich repeat protein [Lachnospiraceae bacterium]